MAVPALSNKTPNAASITWGAFQIQYQGVSFQIAAGSTSSRWVWWRYNGGVGSIIEAGPDIPANLGPDDLLLFGNKNGIGVRVQAANEIDGELLVNGSIFSEAIATGQIVTEHMQAGSIHGDRITAGTLEANRVIVSAANPTPLVTAMESYVQSRGTNLITNGTGLLGTNQNFTPAVFNTADAPPGSGGSFVPGATTALAVTEIIPVDPSVKMKFSFYMRQATDGVQAHAYGAVAPLDTYKNVIAPSHVSYTPGTLTALAAPLNPGDTTVSLVSSANWYGTPTKNAGAATHLRSFIFWDFVDAGGKAWQELTYSRNYHGAVYADGAISNNVVTLSAPWAGPAKPAGTKLSNGTSGSTYMYGGIVNGIVPGEWTQYSSTVQGINTTGTSSTFANGWSHGTAYAKIQWLLNRSSTGAYVAGSKHSVAGVYFGDAQAAADEAATARAEAATAHTRWAPANQTTIDGGKITANSITGNLIMGQTIGAEKLVVGDLSNMAEINEERSIGAVYDNTHTIVNGWSSQLTNTSQYFMFRNQHGPVPFKKGDWLRITFEAYASAATTADIRMWGYGGTAVNQTFGQVALGTNATTAAATPFDFYGPVTVDMVGKTSFLIGLTGAGLVGKNVFVRNARVYRMNAGELIVDGAIRGNHLEVGTITAREIGTGAVTADEIEAGTITADEIATDTITANEIATGTITANEVNSDIIIANDVYAQEGYLGKLNAGQIDTGALTAKLGILGGLEIGTGGNITINPTDGILVKSADGKIHLPADGSAAEITAHVVAKSLTVEDQLSIQGSGQLVGSLELAEGITAPRTPATVSAYVSSFAIGAFGTEDIYNGMVPSNTPNRLVTVFNYLGTIGMRELTDDAPYTWTGDLADSTTQSWCQNAYAGSIARGNNGDFYILVQDHNRPSPGSYYGDWFVYRISATTRNKINEVRIGAHNWFTGGLRGIVVSIEDTIAVMTHNTSTSALVLRLFSTSTLTQIRDVSLISNFTPHGSPLDAHYGPHGPNNENRLYISHHLQSNVLVMKPSVTPTEAASSVISWSRMTNEEFRRSGPSGAVANSITVQTSSGQLLSHDQANAMTMYSDIRVQAIEMVAYSWYDGFGTQIHETPIGTSKMYIRQPRSFLRVDMPPAPDLANQDPLNVNKADQIAVYAAPMGGQMRRQAILPKGQRTWYSGAALSTTGVLANTGTPFPPTVSPGRITSAAADANGPLVDLSGGGGPGRVGHIAWGSNGLPIDQVLTVDGGSHTTTAGSGWFTPTGLAETTFVAPRAGRVMIRYQAYLRANVDGVLMGVCPQVNNGTTPRAGSTVYAPEVLDMIGNANSQVVRGGVTIWVTNLTPGASYVVFPAVYRTAAGAQVNNTRVKVVPY